MIILVVVAVIIVLWAFAKMSADINAGIEREMRGEDYGER